MDGPGLKAWRTGLGLTLPAGAARLCISRATLARYEAGGEIPAKLAEVLASLDEVQDEDTVQPMRGKPGAELSDPVGHLEPDHIADAGKKTAKPTLAEARAIVEASGFVVMTGAELKRLTEPAEGRAHTGPAFERPSTMAAPDRKPGKDAVTVPTERTAGMSKLATVRPATKGRRLVGFTSDGKEIWG